MEKLKGAAAGALVVQNVLKKNKHKKQLIVSARKSLKLISVSQTNTFSK